MNAGGAFHLTPSPGAALVSLPHLRAWLASLPRPDEDPCPICDGTGVLVCDVCQTLKVLGKPCESCTDKSKEPCWCKVPIGLAVLLGVRVRADALYARLTRTQGACAVTRVLGSGDLQIGKSRPIPPYRPSDERREIVVFEAFYAHEQLPLRGLLA